MIPRTIRKKVTAGAGMVLVELIVAVAIIAVLCAVVIPSAVSVNNSLTSKQADDYAKSIYMAAQNHLVNVRTNASLTTLAARSEALGNLIIELPDNAGFPDGFANFPRYVSNGDPAQQEVFDSILPAGSIDATLRDKKILIEYSAWTGDVFSVFFLNEPASAADHLTYGTLVRDASRKDIHLGYYHGQATIEDYVAPTDPPVPEPVNCDTDLNNGMMSFDPNSGTYGDAVVTVTIPVSSDYLSVSGCSMDTFRSNLAVTLKVTGKESGRSFNIDLSADKIPSDSRLKCEFGSGNTLVYTYVLDSVARNLPFSGLSSPLILGENVDLSASVSYNTPIQEVNLVNVSVEGNALWPNANPLYDALSVDTIQVANARQLQNLNCCAVTGIKNVNLSKSFSWYSGRDFAPLSNETLFGTGSRKGSVTSFNGGGNTISGLRISGSGGNTGLFSYLSAPVNQLTLDKVTVSGSCASAGAIAGKALDGAVIGNCSVTNLSMSLSPAAGACVGGLVGEMTGGILSSSSVSGSIGKDGGSTAYVGGAVGKDGSGANYISVDAAVGLSGWGGSGTSAAPDDPSGLGVNVGKFIGYVNDGQFHQCKALGSADRAYRFLGTIATKPAAIQPVGTDSYYLLRKDDWTALGTAKSDSITDTSVITAIKNRISAILGANLQGVEYLTSLDEGDCGYQSENGKFYYQVISSMDYYKYNSATFTRVTDKLVDGKPYLFTSFDGKYIISFEQSKSSTNAVSMKLTPLQTDENGELLLSAAEQEQIKKSQITYRAPSSDTIYRYYDDNAWEWKYCTYSEMNSLITESQMGRYGYNYSKDDFEKTSFFGFSINPTGKKDLNLFWDADMRGTSKLKYTDAEHTMEEEDALIPPTYGAVITDDGYCVLYKTYHGGILFVRDLAQSECLGVDENGNFKVYEVDKWTEFNSEPIYPLNDALTCKFRVYDADAITSGSGSTEGSALKLSYASMQIEDILAENP